ncbi:BTAD domain-containing putative transcriptional regulator [Lentzea sp. NPDC005914]|uniref:AfsR/SARP family transcriptional regulator n=1 Tax=Lentzea sp. NPDC005914 TaxID=3154572 RepID=UPI0033FE70C9
MRLRILGPVEILADHGSALPTRRMARVLLGMLALHANTFVPADRIVDGLWGGCPPPSAPVNLRSYVSDLRRLLRSANGVPRIDTVNGGYLLTAGPDDLDVLAFTALAQKGRDCLTRGDHEQAAELLTRATGLWRGPVLDGTPVPDAVQPTIRMLEDRRVDVIEDCVQARLELGRHAGIAAELRELTGQYELRERLWGQLMLALYRGGRQGEAMQAYDRLRQVLDTELGADPSPEIRLLHQRILRDDPGLSAPATKTRHVPWQLPPDTDPFIGRHDQLRTVDHLATTAAVAAIVGTAAVGKTSLAVHWAHGARGRFPDGCLYVDLRGYGPEPPVPPEQVLAGFLRVLGERDLGLDTAELSGRYRTAIADRRMLIVLDNARAADQVRPLLPGTAGCLVIVTSRDDLAGLVVRDGAHRVRLDPMPPHEARALLGRLIGHREGIDELAQRCAGLPLALRIVAELAAQSDTTLADLALALADRQRGLDELDAGGDPRTAVTAVFDWSHQALPPLAARAFELLTRHPGPDFDDYAAAALLGTTPDEAGRLIGQLCRAHLVQRDGAGRFHIHDLLRAYGRRLACTDTESALTGLFDYYVHATTLAESTLPLGRGLTPSAAITTPPLHDSVHAARWLNAERANLVAVTAHCAAQGHHAHACELSQALRPYLDNGHHLTEAVTVYRHALQAARRLDDPARIGAALNNLGGVSMHLGRYAEAIEHLEAALAIRRQIGDRIGEVRTTSNLAGVYNRLGRHREAGEHYQRSLRIARDQGDQAGELLVLLNLAFVHFRLSRFRETVDCHQRALALAVLLGDRMLQATEHCNLGLAYVHLGRYKDSAESLWHAARMCRELGDHQGEGFLSGNLALLHTRLGNHWVAQRHAERALAVHSASGDLASQAAVLGFQGELLLRMNQPAQALRTFRRALSMNQKLGERFQEGQALNGIAAAALAMHRFDQATHHHDAALALTTAIGDCHGRARALEGIGHVRRGTGDLAAAAASWQEAAALYDEIGVPEGKQLRARLAELTVAT